MSAEDERLNAICAGPEESPQAGGASDPREPDSGVAAQASAGIGSKPLRIYVASSWRNLLQPGIVKALRWCGHDVYDFRHPAPGDEGFSWKEIDGGWQSWTPEQYREALKHPIAARGYAHDIEALRACDACVLVLPSGRSASWEFGYAMGQGKRGAVVMFDACEPELMYRGAEILTSVDDLLNAFGGPVGSSWTPSGEHHAAARASTEGGAR